MKASEFPELKIVDEWAAQRIASGQETPWDWYELMKLREAIRSLIHTDKHSLAWDGSQFDGPALNVVQFDPRSPA